MESNIRDVSMEERLRFILLQVNDWLKYAEMKNSVLLSIDLGLVAILFTLISRDDFPHVVLIIGSALFFISIISLLISFIPRLKILPKKGIKRPDQYPSNLLYFKAISLTTPKEYMVGIYHQLNIMNPSISAMEIDYAEQIISNSIIASHKYRCFNIGFWFSVASLVWLIIFGMLNALGS